uniref:Uncharacterized protein n=1 Tax=Arundo donax TaxID=35708 RepID=A0A0A9CRG8_ARUDO
METLTRKKHTSGAILAFELPESLATFNQANRHTSIT